MLCTLATKEWFATCCSIATFCNLLSPLSIQEMYDCDAVSCQLYMHLVRPCVFVIRLSFHTHAVFSVSLIAVSALRPIVEL